MSTAFLAPVQSFLEGAPVAWGTTTLADLRVVNRDGEIGVEKDERRESKERLIQLLFELAREEPSSLSDGVKSSL